MTPLVLAATFGGVGSILAALVAGGILLMRPQTPADRRPASAVFVLDDHRILDMTETGRDFFSDRVDGECTRERLVALFQRLCTEFEGAMATLRDRRRATLTTRDGSRTLALEHDGRLTRITVTEAETETLALDRASHASMRDELSTLRAMAENLPYPCWREDRQGQIQWINGAYLALVSERAGADPGCWPPAPLFDDAAHVAGETRRFQLSGRTSVAHGWFDVTATRLGDDLILTAMPADALVRSEAALAEFKHTMSRTFAQLTVGLAVFDRDRRLAVFNPALTDLTTLPIDLLLSRPSLESFLDALRARDRMPEPRDYTSWRERVLRVEREAEDGTYSDLWHLPSGQTFRVAGRPQPDGAFALLLEDVSAEIGLTRRFRAEIQTGEAVLDELDDAVAVFDRTGEILITNRSYDMLWQTASQDGVAPMSARDAIEIWRRGTVGEADWEGTQTFVAHAGPRERREQSCMLLDGRPMVVSLAPLPSGSSLVRFSLPAERPERSSDLVPVRGRERIADALKA